MPQCGRGPEGVYGEGEGVRGCGEGEAGSGGKSVKYCGSFSVIFLRIVRAPTLGSGSGSGRGQGLGLGLGLGWG